MELAFEHFEARIGEHFTAVAGDGARIDLELAEAVERAANPNASQGFSLLFRTADRELRRQQIFEVDHPDLGACPMFLVPIAQDDDGVSYEAVFSR